MTEDAETSDDAEDGLDEIMRATARDRRLDGLKMCGGGVGALGLSWILYWASAPEGDTLGNLIVYVLVYGSLLLGIMLLIFGIALVVNSYLIEP